MLTAVVVLPTPPFWLATTRTRVSAGCGRCRRWQGRAERARRGCEPRPPTGSRRRASDRLRGLRGVGVLRLRSAAGTHAAPPSVCSVFHVKQAANAIGEGLRSGSDRPGPAATLTATPPRRLSAPAGPHTTTPRYRSHPSCRSATRPRSRPLLRPSVPSAPTARHPVGPAAGTIRPASPRAATARAVTTSKRLVDVLGARPEHGHLVESEVVDHLVEERRAAQQRLDQRHVEVRPGDRPHQARQAGARPDVGDRRTDRNPRHHHRAVQDVAVPEPRHFTRTDQPALDARGCQ